MISYVAKYNFLSSHYMQQRMIKEDNIQLSIDCNLLMLIKCFG